jgi:DnaJ-class molecular chaperone
MDVVSAICVEFQHPEDCAAVERATDNVMRVLGGPVQQPGKPCSVCLGEGKTRAKHALKVICYACGGSGKARDCYEHPAAVQQAGGE